MVDRSFFLKPTSEEHAEIFPIAQKHYRSTRLGTSVIACLAAAGFVAGLLILILWTSQWLIGTLFFVLSLVFIVIALCNKWGPKEHFEKFRDRHYLLNHVEIVDTIVDDPHEEESHMLCLRSDDGARTKVPVSSSRYKDFHCGMTGVLVIIDGEKGLYHEGGFFFFPDEGSGAVAKDPHNNAFSVAEESVPDAILRAFLDRTSVQWKLIKLLLPILLCIGIFFVFTHGKLKNDWFPMAQLTLSLLAILLMLANLSDVALALFIRKDRRSYFNFALWCLTPVTLLLVIAPLRAEISDTIKYILLGVSAALVLILIFAFCHVERSVSRALRNRNLLAARCEIFKLEERVYYIRRYPRHVPFLTLHLEDGTTLFFPISKSQARNIHEGDKGYALRAPDTFMGKTTYNYFYQSEKD